MVQNDLLKQFNVKMIGSGQTAPTSLHRFVQAQAETFASALAELEAGRKTGHWIWWVLPQLRGLGRSENSVFYGLTGLEEASAYLKHPVLGPRYRECVRIVHRHLCEARVAPLVLMGSKIDVIKLQASLELFAGISVEYEEREVLHRQICEVLRVLSKH
jgi:uncharacterized protein (DUF1810 family)